jgi:hypothetical protein
MANNPLEKDYIQRDAAGAVTIIEAAVQVALAATEKHCQRCSSRVSADEYARSNQAFQRVFCDRCFDEVFLERRRFEVHVEMDKTILPPFEDTVKENSFAQYNWAGHRASGLISFSINGAADILNASGRSDHGALPQPGNGGQEELPIKVQDDKEHLLTLIMPASKANSVYMRVSLIGSNGRTETLRYLNTPDSDSILQFRFQGPSTLRIRMTSEPIKLWLALIGPAAIFFD